jgi:hypothetical protein
MFAERLFKWSMDCRTPWEAIASKNTVSRDAASSVRRADALTLRVAAQVPQEGVSGVEDVSEGVLQHPEHALEVFGPDVAGALEVGLQLVTLVVGRLAVFEKGPGPREKGRPGGNKRKLRRPLCQAFGRGSPVFQGPPVGRDRL